MSQKIIAHDVHHITVLQHGREIDPLFLRVAYGEGQELVLGLSRQDFEGVVAYFAQVLMDLSKADQAATRN